VTFSFDTWTAGHVAPSTIELPVVRAQAASLGTPSVPVAARKNTEAATPFIEWGLLQEFSRNDPHDALVVKDMVIVGTDQGELRAHRCKDGESFWVHWHGARIFHRPSSDGQRIYFTSQNGLTAVKVSDGSAAWNLRLTTCNGPTLVIGKQGLVYVGGNDGMLYAVDAKTGEQKWAADLLADAPPDPPGFPGQRARLPKTHARPTALASDGKILFVSVFDQSRIVAVNAAEGKRYWAFQARGWIYGSAVATEKHVFFGSQDKNYYCLDKKNGQKVWSFKTKGDVESGGAVDHKFVYFGSCDGTVYCLDQATGKEQWRYDTKPDFGKFSRIYSVPLLRGSGVYIASGSHFYAIDKDTGKLTWKFRPSEGSELVCSPATDGERFFIVTRPDQIGSGEGAIVTGVASLVAIRVK
jgi:outer membrane protein assembly factor BamB